MMPISRRRWSIQFDVGEREQFFQEFIKRLEFRQKAGKVFCRRTRSGNRGSKPRCTE